MKLRRTIRGIAAISALLIASPQAVAQDLSFEAYLQLVAAKARGEGVSEGTIDRLLGGLRPSSRVLVLDRDNVSSGGSTSNTYPAMAPYINRHNTAARINGGRSVYSRLGSLGSEIERQYGVPAEILVAIWGHETAYGAVTGSFDLAQALATLAWEGRRRDLFERELIALLEIADSGVTSHPLEGSWAGAFGNPQFLPTVFQRLAVDGDGDGDKDIWDSDTDTLHSIANYFRDAGWRAGEPWGVRAYVPNSVDREAIRPLVDAPVCPRVHERHSRWMTVAEWRELGVEPRAPIPDDTMASLFEPDGAANPGYLLTQNYRVILEYNCSNYYAMSVGLLADEIVR